VARSAQFRCRDLWRQWPGNAGKIVAQDGAAFAILPPLSAMMFEHQTDTE
jgi:hypothetical protein